MGRPLSKEYLCRIDPEVISRLKHVADTPFKRLTYTSAIELLKTAVDEGHKFENSEIVWGMDMSSEHERCCTAFILLPCFETGSTCTQCSFA